MKKYEIKNPVLKEYIQNDEALLARVEADGNHLISLEDVDIIISRLASYGDLADVRLVFWDSYGNEIKPGDKIVIEHNYNYQHWNGREAEVYWDVEHGMLMFKFWTSMRKSGHWTTSNFYGIHKFKRWFPENEA